MNYDLIQAKTEDDIFLNGLYVPGDTTRTACIFIHGFTADFYSHAFYHSIADTLRAQSNALILAQTRGTGLQTEFLKPDGEGVFIGSYYEKLEEAHLDITAFIDYLYKQGYSDIALAGHSLGTLKAARYLFVRCGNHLTCPDSNLGKIISLVKITLLEYLRSPTIMKDMKSVVICGSKRFKPDMRNFAAALKKFGVVVHEPYLHSGQEEWINLSDAYKKFIALGLTHDHFYKIKMADVVFVYNKDGYSGNSTTLELGYAVALGKPI